MSALRWWQERCLEWCYASRKMVNLAIRSTWTMACKVFGYTYPVTYWVEGWLPGIFNSIRLEKQGGQLLIDGFPVIFYHFHRYRCYQNGAQNLGDYWLKSSVVDLLYRPYVSAHGVDQSQLWNLYNEFNYGCSSWETSYLSILMIVVKSKLKGEYNVYKNIIMEKSSYYRGAWFYR